MSAAETQPARLPQVVPLVERHHALTEVLRTRAPRPTSARLPADRLGVSARAMERDIVELGEAGFALSARGGPGGGYRLDARSSTCAVQLSTGETSVLIAALVAVSPFGSATARSACVKLIAALTEEQESR